MPAPKSSAKKVSKPAAVVAPTPATIIEKSEVKGSGTPKVPATAPALGGMRIPSHSEIQQRAYDIYAGRGYAPGDPTADWLEAERQLKAGL